MNDYAYGLWPLAAISSITFLIFTASFFHPHGGRDWRALGGFSAFVVALFTEMFGFPLTIYLLSGPLGRLVPGIDFTHGGGHLWADLIGWKGDPHLSPFHLVSYVLIALGLWLIAAGWRALYAAVRDGRLATRGLYARVRHPQYLGFIVIMVGFLVQWPTFVTAAMFPVLLVMYRRLAIREEREVHATFGLRWERYAARTPRFIPRLRPPAPAGTAGNPSQDSGKQPDERMPKWPSETPSAT